MSLNYDNNVNFYIAVQKLQRNNAMLSIIHGKCCIIIDHSLFLLVKE